jgi:hypothetical protein
MGAENEDQQSDRVDLPDQEYKDAKSNDDFPNPSNDGDAKNPILAWASLIRVFADAEPTTAASAAGVLILIVLFVFGRVGSLIVGVLAGLLLHASFEKAQITIPSRELFRLPPESERAVDREVSLFSTFHI